MACAFAATLWCSGREAAAALLLPIVQVAPCAQSVTGGDAAGVAAEAQQPPRVVEAPSHLEHEQESVHQLPQPLSAPLSFRDAADGMRDGTGRIMLKNLTLPQLQEWCTAHGARLGAVQVAPHAAVTCTPPAVGSFDFPGGGLHCHHTQCPTTTPITPSALPSPPHHPYCAGESVRRGLQLWRWLYYDNNWVASLEETIGRQNGVSATFAAKAAALASVDGGLLLERVVTARDGTRKLAFKLTEGEGAGAACQRHRMHARV